MTAFQILNVLLAKRNHNSVSRSMVQDSIIVTHVYNSQYKAQDDVAQVQGVSKQTYVQPHDRNGPRKHEVVIPSVGHSDLPDDDRDQGNIQYETAPGSECNTENRMALGPSPSQNL